ncbi:hypothetical protein [Falsiroseomonas sp. HW251]|uniref:hypothetical protein n=1 Tax=Falsiroseomonas sp. HW251 TaxID=3390998 RepID=UPI003D31407E
MTMTPTVSAAFVSEHRFRLTLGACLLALALMLGVIHLTVGLGPPWGGPAFLPT